MEILECSAIPGDRTLGYVLSQWLRHRTHVPSISPFPRRVLRGDQGAPTDPKGGWGGRFALVLLVLGALYLLIQYQWYDTASESSPGIGVNFSCKRAEYLGQDCHAALAEVLDDLGARSFRLSIYWSDVEQAPGQYDWSSIDWQLDMLRQRGARAVVTVGMKAQRYPEFWLPTWLRLAANIPENGFPEDNPLIPEYLFPYLDAATRHLRDNPAVDSIQVENEPFVHFQGHANGWHIRRAFLAREIATVRAADGGIHRISISHASWLRRDDTWKWILDNADVVSQSVYTKRQRGPWSWLYIFPYRLGPFTPNLPGQAREAARRGKELWIAELQAEPYEQPTVDVRRGRGQAAASFSPRWLEDNLRLARRSGATRVYLWGVEWWMYLRDEQGDSSLWDAGRRLFGPTSVTRNENSAPPGMR